MELRDELTMMMLNCSCLLNLNRTHLGTFNNKGCELNLCELNEFFLILKWRLSESVDERHQYMSSMLLKVARKHSLVAWERLIFWEFKSIGHNLFSISFPTTEDKDKIFETGLVSCSQGVIHLMTWSPDFNPNTFRSSLAQVWFEVWFVSWISQWCIGFL